ncbi:MAG: signal transduction histidine kinase [Pirellulaceae bacterium]|jgi:signal transduction histidine kinase
MRFLEINDGNQSFSIPFRRGLGQRLLDFLLEDKIRSSDFDRLLVEFPELALWCLIQWRADSSRNSIASLSEAFNDVVLECLQGFEFSSITGPSFPPTWQKLVSESNASFHRQDGDHRPDGDHNLESQFHSQQGLCALLHNAGEYLNELGAAESVSELLPEWFCEALNSSQFNNEPTSESIAGDEPACDAEFAQLLSRIVNMRHRLKVLESDFAESLHCEKMKSMKELAYGASHEINNPLANISTRAQTLLRDEQDPERRKKLASINSQAFRAHEMISNMMHFAKPPELQLQRVDLTEIVETVVAELQQDADIQQTELIVVLAGKRIQFDADPTHLGKSLKALIINALEATRRDGTVTITVGVVLDSFGEDQVVISVSDTGPGIPAGIREQIFDPFFSGREAGRGLGFGLSKSWQVVQQHKGQILLQTSDCGTTFELHFPKRQNTPKTSAQGDHGAKQE